MRIAVIAPPFVPVPTTGYGGTELIVDSLSRGFQDAGHEVTLFTVGESTCPVPKRYVFQEAKTQQLNWSVVEMKHLLHAYEEARDYDIVHDHTVLGPTFSERFRNLSVVMTQHHPWNEEFTDIFAASAHRVPIVGISHHQARQSPGVPVERVIHHGIDANAFTFNPNPDDYFAFLGRMSPNKGAARAAAVARQAGVKLKIAARMSDSEGERDYYENEVKPLLGDGVEYIGEVSAKDKGEFLANSRALLNPIRWPEPFGLVMVEAMAAGTPVIGFAEGAAPEIIRHGETGFIAADEADMASLVNRIDEIDRRDCRASIEGYFSSERMVNDYIDLFEDLVARKQANRAMARESVVDLNRVQVPQRRNDRFKRLPAASGLGSAAAGRIR